MLPLIEQHRSEPEVSLAGLLGRRKVALAASVLKRRRVYLDTRYWIFLRDAVAGRAQRREHTELLEILRSGVAAGRFICPLNDSTFFELTRQRDTGLLLAAARLMDELSLGVTIQNGLERVRTEVRDFLVQITTNARLPRSS